MRQPVAVVISIGLLAVTGLAAAENDAMRFNAERDLLALHYDHAPD